MAGADTGGVDGVASHPPHQNNKNQDNKEMIDTLTWWCATTMSQHENDRSASELPCISHAKFNSSTASHPPPSLNPESAPVWCKFNTRHCGVKYVNKQRHKPSRHFAVTIFQLGQRLKTIIIGACANSRYQALFFLPARSARVPLRGKK